MFHLQTSNDVALDPGNRRQSMLFGLGLQLGLSGLNYITGDDN